MSHVAVSGNMLAGRKRRQVGNAGIKGILDDLTVAAKGQAAKSFGARPIGDGIGKIDDQAIPFTNAQIKVCIGWHFR